MANKKEALRVYILSAGEGNFHTWDTDIFNQLFASCFRCFDCLF